MARDYAEWVDEPATWRDLLMPRTIGRLEYIGRQVGLFLITMLLVLAASALIRSDAKAERGQETEHPMAQAGRNAMQAIEREHPDVSITDDAYIQLFAERLSEEHRTLLPEQPPETPDIHTAHLIASTILIVAYLATTIFFAHIPRARDLSLPWPRLSALLIFVPLLGVVYQLVLMTMPANWYKERF